jgi:uncharacterized protein YbaR (Trm112 family)
MPAPGTAQVRRHAPRSPGLTSTPPNFMDPKLLDLLVCPVTKAPLALDRARNELLSQAAGLAYPIRDGIPVLIEDEARRLGADELDALRRQ